MVAYTQLRDQGAVVGFWVVDSIKKCSSGGVLDLKVVTRSEVIPVSKVDFVNAISSGSSVLRRYHHGSSIFLFFSSTAQVTTRPPDAAAIEIDSRFYVVAIPPNSNPQPVRRFDTVTGDLPRQADWLSEQGILTIAMGFTGVYWISCFGVAGKTRF